jgi:putative DNA-invertase from lambdoid prophage Rac
VTRAAIWARVSTTEQDASNQVTELCTLAARRGWTVVEIDSTTASAWRGDHRRELDRVVADARAGKFDVLLVWALDRLSREGPLETLQIVDRLARAGVQVVSLQEPWTEATGELRDLMVALVGWVARWESRRRSERTRAGMERARAEGKRIGRPPRPPVETHRRWPETRDLVLAGVLTSAEGARRLRVRRVDFAAAIKAARGVQKGEAPNGGSSEFGPTA